MVIPESQLATWSSLGAQKGSADTYASIKIALEAHRWPNNMTYTVYLQGSYPNHTNIRGDSDVDIVVETNSLFYHDVPDFQRVNYGLTTPGTFSWQDFRDEVQKALSNHYGSPIVTRGNKCIKVSGSGNRLNADVVPCAGYRTYSNSYTYAKGITFWTRSGIQVINYPKLHLANGSAKNQDCYERYKPNVRVLKNARNRAQNDFPSYFLECLLYNVPNHKFNVNFENTFYEVLDFLDTARKTRVLSSFRCQNGQQMMFGEGEHQINIITAHSCIDALINLWNNW